MKNTIKLFGIITLLAVIGFSMVACDNGTADAEGTFTITDIPAAYNGKYALFGARINCGGKTVWGDFTKINNGKAVIPLLYNGDTYKGNDTFIDNDNDGGAWVNIFEAADWDTQLTTAFFQSVTFSNGSDKKSWNDRIKN